MECGQRKSLADQAPFQCCLALTPSLPTPSLSQPRRQTILPLSHLNLQHFAPSSILPDDPSFCFMEEIEGFRREFQQVLISSSPYLLTSVTPFFVFLRFLLLWVNRPYSRSMSALDLIPSCLFKDFAPTILPSLHCQIFSLLHLSQNIQIWLYFCHLENV